MRLQKQKGKWQISALFDFADSLCGISNLDFVAIGLLMIRGQSQIQRKFFNAYGSSNDAFDENFRKRLMLMTVLYECTICEDVLCDLRPKR